LSRLALIAALIFLAVLMVSGPAAAQVNGVAVDSSTGVLLLGSPAGAANCKAATTGAIRYNSTNPGIQYCDGTSWRADGGMTFISTQTASASASLQWTGLTGNNYLLTCTALLPTTNNDTLYTRFGEGGTPTWDTDSQYQYDGNGNLGSNYNVSALPLIAAASNASGAPSGHWFFYGLATAGINHEVEGSAFDWSGTQKYFGSGGVYFGTTNAITAIELYYGAGTVASGKCSLYLIN
jgi:hypothetical protein